MNAKIIDESCIWFSGDATSLTGEYVDGIVKEVTITVKPNYAYVIMTDGTKTTIGGSEMIHGPFTHDDSTQAIISAKTISVV